MFIVKFTIISSKCMYLYVYVNPKKPKIKPKKKKKNQNLVCFTITFDFYGLQKLHYATK